MSNNVNYRAAVDQAGVMTKLSAIGTIVSAVFALLLLFLGVIKSSFSNSDTFAVVLIPFTIAALFGLAATLYGVFAKGAAMENEEKMLLAKRRDNSMLSVDEDVRFTRQRSFDNFGKYAPYVLSILGAVVIVVIVMLFFQHWNSRSAELRETVLENSTANPMYMVFVAAVLGVIALFTGAFYNGQSRDAAFRWLRPFGAWMIAGAVASAAAIVAGLCFKSGYKSYDGVIAKVLLAVYLVLAAEMVLSFVVEFYRPRTLEEFRPVFESRILALFTEPGGVMRNFANMLDYQFGFKVSATWFYSFVERALFPLIVMWALLLWGATTMHEVAPNEIGLRSNFGKLCNPEKPLPPGIYFTMPWPFGKVDKFSCDTIYEVTIGHEDHGEHEEEEEVEDDGHGHAKPEKKKKTKDDNKVILWTAEHGEGNNNFLVAHREKSSAAPKKKTADAQSNGNAAEVMQDDDGMGDFYFVGLTMPIQYHIRPEGVYKYVYGNVDSKVLIKNIGHMVVTRYLAGAPFYEVITYKRRDAEIAIKDMLQQECDKQDLGVEIISVNLVGIHPPTQVGAEFQNVFVAQEQCKKMDREAETAKIVLINEAEAEAFDIKQKALAYKNKKTAVAKAEEEQFRKQLTAYRVNPRLFRLRLFLDFLQNDCKDVRKYIISSDLKGEVFELNLEEKERLSLLDSDLGK